MSGKGSSPRPYSVPKESFDQSFERIFGITCKRCGKRGLQPDSTHNYTSKEVREQIERWEPRIGTPERKEWQEDENRKARARLDAIPIREGK